MKLKWIYVDRAASVVTLAASGASLFGGFMNFCLFFLGFGVAGCFYMFGRRLAYKVEIATLSPKARKLLDLLYETKEQIIVKNDRVDLNGETFDLATVNMLLNRGFVRVDKSMILGGKLDAAYSISAKGVLAYTLKIVP